MNSLPNHVMPDVRGLWADSTPGFIAFSYLTLCLYTFPYCRTIVVITAQAFPEGLGKPCTGGLLKDKQKVPLGRVAPT